MLKLNSKANKIIFLCCVCLAAFYPVTALANSSWHWVMASPMKVLPVAIILTLAIETWGIAAYGKVKEKMPAFITVAFANIASFTVPYTYRAFRLNGFYGSGWSYAWERAFNNGPNYIIRSLYLVLTLCIETPLVYFFLRNRCKSKKQLLNAIVIVNIITTAIVAVLERLLCRGRW